MIFEKNINIIIQRLIKLWDRIDKEDKLIAITIDEAWDNGILLTFARYNGCNYNLNDTYKMRAIVGKDKIIYENDDGKDFRDYIDEYEISLEEYDSIMAC